MKPKAMNTLGIFVKHPVVGRVKTRLAEAVGAEQAVEIYAAFVVDLVERFRRAADRRVLCFTPDHVDTKKFFQMMAGRDYHLWSQPDGSLGKRMVGFFAKHITSGNDRVALIGSDSPVLPEEYIDQAFSLLDNNDCVLGPATDGGFYLIGQRGRPWAIFDDVDWSGPRVLEQTVAKITACDARLGLLPACYDVDTLDDLQVLRGHIQAMRQAGMRIDLVHTESILFRDTAHETSQL